MLSWPTAMRAASVGASVVLALCKPVKLHNSCCRIGGLAVLQRLLPDMMVEFLRKDKLARVLPGPSVYDHR